MEKQCEEIVNSTYISLDGEAEKPHEWPSMGDDAGAPVGPLPHHTNLPP